MSRLYGQFVTLGTESGNHAGRDVREERMLPEVLPRKNVGQVHLDERDGNAQQGIAQGDAGMRERTRIENDQGDALLAGTVYPLHQLVLRITLEPFQLVTEPVRRNLGLPDHFLKRLATVDFWFAPAQKVKIWTV